MKVTIKQPTGLMDGDREISSHTSQGIILRNNNGDEVVVSENAEGGFVIHPRWSTLTAIIPNGSLFYVRPI